MSTADRLVRALERAHDGQPWHGPSRAAILADVTWEEAAWRPAPDAHTIWELVLHMRSWTREVTRRATGGAPAQPADGDWPVVSAPSAASWADALASLDSAHDELTTLLGGRTEEELAAKVKSPPGDQPDASLSHRSMLGSLVEHDIYHSGQLALLKRLARNPHKSRISA